jgi:predicted Zn-dependent protease
MNRAPIVLSFICGVVCTVLGAAEPVPVAELLARGQASLRQGQAAAAEADFRAALERQPELRPAHLGLAQCAAAREDWLAASRSAAAGIEVTTADAAQLAFLASVAERAGDWRLATLAAQHGILRFPDDDRLRRTELAVLVHAGRAEDARQALLALLSRAPGDAGLWRHLAWAARESGHGDESMAALEAAVLLQPDAAPLRRHLAAAQLAGGQPQAAARTILPLMQPVPIADDELLLLGCRATAEAGDPGQARRWLDAVPDASRTRTQRLLAARLAAQDGDDTAATAVLEALIAAGESDASVLVWAAAMAERSAQTARAEMLYLRAVQATGPAAAIAELRLVALYIRLGRRDEAGQALSAYLLRHPGDQQALALLAHLAPAK